MLELYIIRHGLAGKSLEDQAEDDARPLKKKGKDQLKDIAKILKDEKISFDVILTSPLLRAVETAEIMNDHCGTGQEPTVTDLLLPETPYSNLIKLINSYKNYMKVAIVGHEPFLSGFASYCITGNKSSFINLKKGGIILLELEGIIKPGHCQLTWLIDPKLLIQRKSHE